MAGRMCREGGVIHLGADVTGLEVVGKRVKAVRYRVDGQEHLLPCSWVFSTISLPALVRYIAPQSTNGVGAAINGLRSRALRFLNIPLDIPDFSENTWMYIAEPQYKMSRIQEPKRRSPEMVPPGKTSIMLEIPCSVGDAIWDADGDTLFREMSIELRSLGFDIDAIALGHHSVWVEHGYPIYHLGYQHDRDTLLGEVAKMDNVLTGGRQGIFRYIFLDTAMEMGIEAAHQIMQEARNLKHIGSIRMEKELLEVTALTAT
jgi:protoporphyrinogen oxidase